MSCLACGWLVVHMHASRSQQAEAIDMTACVACHQLMLMVCLLVSMLRADRLMGFKENAREVAANLPGLLQKEKY